MDEYIEKWLYDIWSAISEIEEFFTSNEKTFEAFSNNIILKRAIERDLEIIGEAINRILIKDPSVFIENARKIVDLRNHIIHRYDDISDQTIWSVITNNLPILKADIGKLLDR